MMQVLFLKRPRLAHSHER